MNPANRLESFEKWWEERQKHIPKSHRRRLKNWAWAGWCACIKTSVEEEKKRHEDFQRRLDEDAAKGIDIHSLGYWGDFG